MPMRTLASDLPLTGSASERGLRENTWQGQASWATGPHICCDCSFFKRRVDKGSCDKAKKLLSLKRGKWFPCTARSCWFFRWKRRPGPKGRHVHAGT